MRDIAVNPSQAVWFLDLAAQFPVASLVDLSTCQLVASGTVIGLSAVGPTLATIGCGSAFVGLGTGSGGQLFSLLRSGGIGQSTGTNFVPGLVACAWDAANGRLAILTSTQVLEVATNTWIAAWATNHGLTLAGIGSIDCDRNGNVVIAGGGQAQVYAGATGAMTASAAVTGAAFCRFDAGGSIYVGGTGSLEKYGPGLTPLIWSVSTAIACLSVGDQSVWVEVDVGASRSVLKLNPTTGNTINTTANCVSPCAVPGDQAAAIQFQFGVLGPTVCLISPSGVVARTGDLLGAYQSITTSVVNNVVVYTTTGPTLSEPGIGRIGAFAW